MDLSNSVLATDQYQLAMAQLYWKQDIADRPAQFDYFFRHYPDYGNHQAGYCITAGLGWLLDWMESTRFGDDEIEALESQRTISGQPRFDRRFLDWLLDSGDFSGVQVEAVAEGRVVHANAPIAVVKGPLAMCQILETSFLNRINYPTLIATKAARVDEAARDSTVLEFGMRRGPHIGVHAGSFAALVGGADFTSNVALSHAVGLDPKGTHAHSLVQAVIALGGSERDAFRQFAELYPDECVLLVDTIDVVGSGIPNAIAIFEELRRKGHEPVGIRIDSGDLAYLSIQAAQMLDEAGFEDVAIVLSSDLDELVIWQILSQLESDARRAGLDPARLIGRMTFGVGTRLISSHGAPALGGVFKLVAIQDRGEWRPAIKLSETVDKMPIPGEKKVFRLYDQRGLSTADVVARADEELGTDRIELFHPHHDVGRTLESDDISGVESLLEPVFSGGQRQDGSPDLETLRNRRREDLERLDSGVRRLVNPHIYHVSLTRAMKELQSGLVLRLRDSDAGGDHVSDGA